MNIISILFNGLPLLIEGFSLPWWLSLIIIAALALPAVIFHKLKIKRLVDEKAEMERKMLEKKELLTYSTENEQSARQEADMANRSKSMLLSKITHEIRTPLNAMMGMASLLNETPLTPEQRGFTASIIQSGNGLLTLTDDILMNDILEFSKVDSAKELEFKNFDLRNSIEEVLNVFGTKAAQSNVDLVYNISDKVPLHLIGDAYRLRQVLMNLVENALRFTNRGEIFIGVNLISSKEDNKLILEFKVRDTGIGMASSRSQMVSEDLLSPNLDKSGNKCIGLTLIICKKLVSLMGGSLKVESRQGEGTSFRFWISTQAGLQPLRSSILSEMAGSENKKVLIVDDNAAMLNALVTRLTEWKLIPTKASSGKEALQLLTKKNFDLVITDLQMPGMTGIELTESIKKLHPNLPVVLLNNTGDESFRPHATLFSGVVSKPVKHHLLSKQIFVALKQKVNSSLPQKQKLTADFAIQHPLRILIAEDDSMNQHLLKTILGKLGYQSHICNNGKEVLEEVSNNKYDMILMDVQMPEMDGLEATRMIRLCISEQPVIIAMTANTLQGDREDCLRSGMDDYISKPVNLEELVGLLEKWSLQVKHNNNA